MQVIMMRISEGRRGRKTWRKKARETEECWGGGGTEWRMTADAAVPSCPYRAKHVQHVSLSVFTAPHTHRQAQSKTRGDWGEGRDCCGVWRDRLPGNVQ